MWEENSVLLWTAAQVASKGKPLLNHPSNWDGSQRNSETCASHSLSAAATSSVPQWNTISHHILFIVLRSEIAIAEFANPRNHSELLVDSVVDFRSNNLNVGKGLAERVNAFGCLQEMEWNENGEKWRPSCQGAIRRTPDIAICVFVISNTGMIQGVRSFK